MKVKKIRLKSPKVRRPKQAMCKVCFEYFAPQAKSVLLGGSFNDWKPKKALLKRGHDGNWKIELRLAAGRYEYRYQVDGDWRNDQRPVECVPNVFGTWNCVIEVSPSKR